MGLPSFFSEPQVQFLQAVLEEVRDGRIQIPRFQRPFVWTVDQQTELLNSIRDGLPIGAMMVWRTNNEGIACYDRLGPYLLKPRPTDKGDLHQYLLDGHQRTATLYKAFFPPPVESGPEEDDPDDPEQPHRAYVDLVSGEFLWRKEAGADVLMPLDVTFDTVKFMRFLRRIPERFAQQIERAEHITRAFREYKIAVIPMVSDDLNTATRTFERINSQGTAMSTKHMVHALTWSESFDLQSRLEELKAEHLAPVGWAGISDDRVLDVCSVALGLPLLDRDVDKLSDRLRAEPATVEIAVKNIRVAAQFFGDRCGIFAPDLVPHKEQLTLITEGLRSCPETTESALETLRVWVWLSTYGELFASAHVKRMIGMLTEDVRRMAKDAKPRWPDTRRRERRSLSPGVNLRTARGKALAIRLAERARRSPSDAAPLRFLAERGTYAIQRLFRHVEPSRRGSPGNCFLADEPGIGFLRGRLQTLPPGPELSQLRHEHVISDTAFELLRGGRTEDFIDQRRADLDKVETDFFEGLKTFFQDALPSRER